VVAREASCGEQGGACTREVGRGQVSGKKTEKKSGTPVEAKGTVNDIRLSLAGAGGDVGDGVGCHGARVEHGVADTASQAAASALTVRGEPCSGL
jgi:hypothetical protein